ncbi:MAG: phospho-sugar mutase [Ruminococcaceae bacterium]|nr:phospho-sugar mutase [Oscillospiraceae bacterium]
MNEIMAKYDLWRARAIEDADVTAELASVEGNEAEIRDRFYRELAFGTGGLRGVIGAGSNRMNIYTVRKATQGLADYLNDRYDTAKVAVSFDSRIKSDLFAREAACVLAANGISVHLFPQLEPTPVLSYAVRYYGCEAGIMVTASHNPAKYNGYKVYGADGCQITDDDAAAVTSFITKVDLFEDVKTMAYDQAVAAGKINLIPDSVLDSYTDKVLEQQVNPGIIAESGLRLVYTPLNGTGNLPVREMLRRVGIQDLTIVKEQELPDGNFPTAPFPNPEIRQAFECALATAKALPQPADLLLATDPDCDRVGIAVWDGNDYTLMSGNEVGCLLLDYVVSCRKQNGTLPENPVVIKTIVTTNMAKSIAQKYDCELRDLLTGFKYIGEQIGLLEKEGQEHRYVIGFEESYGYLAGGYVRDKDAVVASMLIVEMASYYRKQGLSLLQRMEQLYLEHGFYRNALVNVAFEGEQGMLDMQKLMAGLRECPPKTIAGIPVVAVADYGQRVATDLLTGDKTPLTLPKSDVLAYTLEGGAGFIVRPSGTEPKVKAYITAIGETPAAAAELEQKLCAEAEKILTV